MGDVIRTTKFMPEIINTGAIKNYEEEKPFNPEKDELLEKNIILGNEESEQRKNREKRNILAVAIIIVLIIIVTMFGIFSV